MKDFLRALSPRFEFWFVVLGAFGWLILVSLLAGTQVLHQKTLNTIAVSHLLVYEVVVGAVLLGFLYLRGWRLQTIGLRPTLADTGWGIALLLGTNLLWSVIFYITWAVSPATVAHMQAMQAQLFGQVIPWVPLITLSLINSLFEEVFVAGYVITALKSERGMWFAVNVSVAIRLLYHLYQGQMGVLGALPIGLAYSWFYGRTGRLWPLIVAHALQDLAGMAMQH